MILGHTVPVSLLVMCKCVAFLEIEKTFAWFSEKLRGKRCILKLQVMRKFGSILNTKNAVQACLLHRLFFSYILWPLFRRVVLSIYLLRSTNFQYSFWARTEFKKVLFFLWTVQKAALGGFILFFGFLAFNGGSQASISKPGDADIVSLAIVNTVIGGELYLPCIQITSNVAALNYFQLFFQFQDTKSVLLLLSLLFRIRRCIDCHDYQAHGICGETLEFAFYH